MKGFFVWLLFLLGIGCSSSPDLFAPGIVARVPMDGAENVFLADEISVTFSEPILASSVNAGTVRLLNGANAVLHTATLDGSRTKLLVRLTTLPSFPADFTLSLAGLTDAAGNALPASTVTFAASAWQSLGLTLDSAGTAKGFPIMSMNGDMPVVAWLEYNTSQLADHLLVKRWTGSTWQSLGAALNLHLARDAKKPALVLDSSNYPVLAWLENDGTADNVFVKRWNGSVWTEVRHPSFPASLNIISSHNAQSTALALDSFSNPIVAWAEYDGVSNHSVFVKRWTGTNWEQIGGVFLDVNGNADAISPSLAVAKNNDIFVIWDEADEIRVKKWNGSIWQSLSGLLNSTRGNNPKIALTSGGAPVVTWDESNTADSVVKVKQWDGTTWQGLGTTLNTLINAVQPSLVGGSNPTVLIHQSEGIKNQLDIARWNGSAWVYFAGFNPSKFAPQAALGLNSRGLPVVALIDSFTKQLVVKRINEIPQ